MTIQNKIEQKSGGQLIEDKDLREIVSDYKIWNQTKISLP